VVYYFGAQGGGGPQANIDRWIGQMQRTDGGPAKDSARTASRTINRLTVSPVDVSGAYVAEVRPGATEHFNKPDFRLMAAVVNTPRGAYSCKLAGPSKTVGAASRAYDRSLESIRCQE